MKPKRIVLTLSIIILLVIGARASEAIEFTIFADSGQYNVGDKMNIYISCINDNKEIKGDLYIMVLDPAGKLYFMPDQTLQYFAAPKWTDMITHAVPDLAIPGSFKLKDLQILSFVLPAVDIAPPVVESGDYTLGIAFTKPDTLEIMNLNIYSFNFNNSIAHTQSDCIGTPIYTTDSDDNEVNYDGSISVAVDGNDITISHIDVVYNCAAIIVSDTYFSGENQINIIEHETLPNGAANCICKFNLETKIEDLAPGKYTLKVYRETTAYKFGEFEFTIDGSFSYKSTNCKGKPTSGSYYGKESTSSDGLVLFQIDGSNLYMKHTDVEYNCNAVIALSVKVEDKVITFNEEETYPNGGPVYCLCLFDVVGILTGLEPGVYTAKVVNESLGKQYAEVRITIEGEKYFYTQSPCKGEPIYFTKEASGSDDTDKEIVKIFAKDSKIFIQHFNVVYNCGAVIVPEVKQDGNKFIIRELETLPNGAMRCMCRFDFEMKMDVTEKGTYSVELWNEDMTKMFGSAEVRIE